MKKIALLSATVALCLAGQASYAHTGVRAAGMEGVSGFNDFTITHGCNDNVVLGPSQDVIAMGVLFPNAADPALANVYKLDSRGIQQEKLPDLSNDIEGVAPGAGFANLGVRLVAGNNTLFGNLLPTLDANGAIRGYQTWSGPRPYNTPVLPQSVASVTGLSPWRYGAVRFKASSCAKSLRVRIAIANWCKKGRGTATDGDRLDAWMGHATAVFNDQRTMPRATPYNAATEVPFWPTFIINRNLATNPLGTSCNDGYDVSIEPSDADIDNLLPPPHGAYPRGIAGPRYFPTI